MSILEDLTTLTPKRLERRLEELAREALPCVSAVAFEANPDDGLTVGLWVESEGRRDVLDLARVLETEPGGHVATGWSLLSPSKSHHYWRLLLRVQFERPVLCSFVVRFDVRDHPQRRRCGSRSRCCSLPSRAHQRRPPVLRIHFNVLSCAPLSSSSISEIHPTDEIA